MVGTHWKEGGVFLVESIVEGETPTSRAIGGDKKFQPDQG
jgi:hypothetical protein